MTVVARLSAARYKICYQSGSEEITMPPALHADIVIFSEWPTIGVGKMTSLVLN
jgi:hypothetical protein